MKVPLLSATFAMCAGLSLGAGAAELKQMRDLYSAGYVPLNEINAPLLHHVHTGKPFDTWTLLDNAGTVLPPEIHAKYRLYLSGTSAPENKDRVARELTAFTYNLAESMRLAKGYLVRLTHQAPAYDARRKVLPVGLNMPVDKTDADNGRYYCPGGFARIDAQLMTSCLSVRKWESAHAELKEIPLPDRSLADMIARGLSTGGLAFYALLQPEAPYQPARSSSMAAIPGQPGKTMAGTQPVKLIGLALVNQQTGGIVNVARIDPAGDIFQAAKDGAGPQATSDPAAPAKSEGQEQAPAPGKPGTGESITGQEGGAPTGPAPSSPQSGGAQGPGSLPGPPTGTRSPGNADPAGNDPARPPAGTPAQGPNAQGPSAAGVPRSVPRGGGRIIPYAEYSTYPENRTCVANLRSQMSYAGPLEGNLKKMLAQWCHITANQAAQMFQYPVVIDEKSDVGNASIANGAAGEAHLRFGIGLLKLNAEHLNNFILAHELAHFLRQHFTDRMEERAKLALIGLGGAGATWVAGKKTKIGGWLVAGGASYLAYQQICKLRSEYAKNELEADAEGMAILAARGLDVALAAKSFNNLLLNNQDQLKKKFPNYQDELSCKEYVQGYVKGWFGGAPVEMHPPYRLRRQNMEDQLRSHGARNPDALLGH